MSQMPVKVSTRTVEGTSVYEATVHIPEDIVALFVILSTENSSSSSIFGFRTDLFFRNIFFGMPLSVMQTKS